jgi:hypothetical protein
MRKEDELSSGRQGQLQEKKNNISDNTATVI